MTNREFYTAVMEGNVNEEVIAHAASAIEKLDVRNARKTSKPTKTQTENIPVKNAIVGFLRGKEEVYTASAIAENVGISVQKASALLRQLVSENLLTVEDVKVPKKGVQKGYKVNH